MLMHILPNSFGSVIGSITFAIPGYIVAEATLSYIGIGIRPPYPTWGNMVLEGYSNISAAPHLAWMPAACIAILSLAFTFLGDGIRDALDPHTNE
jgi:ABC-type dipeptide/oligopeptide/nickel transport system permease subunit